MARVEESHMWRRGSGLFRGTRGALVVGLALWSAVLVSVAEAITITEFPLPTPNSVPRGITTGPDGALWFTLTEYSSAKIGRITTAGAITEFPLPTPNSVSRGITAGPDGALWFTEASANKIGRITTAGAITEFSLPTAGSFPLHITTGPDGALWFTENTGRIGRITTDGAITEFSVPTANSFPVVITTGPDGALWFTERDGNRIGRITTAGAITEFPLPTANSEPIGITAGPDGALWFIEASANRIGRITTDGTVTEFSVPTANSLPLQITAGPDGALWFIEASANRIGRITTDGTVTEFALPTAGISLVDITAGPDGALWFTEAGSGKIGRITTTPLTFDLSISVLGSGTGMVTSAQGEITCAIGNTGTCSADLPVGTSVTLIASPAGGAIFAGWGGDCAGFGTVQTCTLTMDSPKSVTAAFNVQPSSGAEELFVTNLGSSSITVYSRTASGNTPPLRTLAGLATGLGDPYGLAVDAVHDELVVTNAGARSITVYPRTASGNTPPLRKTPFFLNFGLLGLALDAVHNELFVADGAPSIIVYPRTLNGVLRTLTGLAGASFALAVDVVNDELVVANYSNNSITVYPRTASGNTPPLRTLAGPATMLNSPGGVVVDLVHDELVVTSNIGPVSVTGVAGTVLVFPRTASGNTPPLRTLAGPATMLNSPGGVVVDLVHDELVVANSATTGLVTVYPRTASGNTPPLRTLAGPATGLNQPYALAIATEGTALFEPLAVSVLGDGTGTVTSNPGGITCSTGNTGTCSIEVTRGIPVVLMVSPGFSATFSGWGGDCAGFGTAQTCILTMSVPKIVTATFGQQPAPTGTASAFVTRLYEQVLNRGPDPAGLQAFIDQIEQSGSVVPTVLAFFHSSEFLARNTSDEQFLTILYHTFLNRDPDPAGFNAFLMRLQADQLTRDNLLDIFIDSAEFASQASFLPPQDPATAFVTTLYVRILGRGPDEAGLQGFVGQVQRASCTVLPIIQTFLASPEFLARNTSNTEFVTLLYRVFLNRVPDSPSLTAYTGQLTTGLSTRAQLVAQFGGASEFQTRQQQFLSPGLCAHLQLFASGHGSVTVSPGGIPCGPGCHGYTPGTTVTLTAQGGPSFFGSRADFFGWGGDCAAIGRRDSDSHGTCTLVMTTDKNVSASFACPIFSCGFL